MIKVDNIDVLNIDNALRGSRNPLESWEQSDSRWVYKGDTDVQFIIGKKDLELALKLIKAGTDHSKFMRQIFVSMDITAPLYFFKEFDTYKISTVADSTSTMHKLGSRLLTIDDFSWDKITGHRDFTLWHLNELITKWQQTKDREVWREIIQDLPDSFNQLRTWTGNYQNLRNMWHNRRFHKLDEWRDFCRVIEDLPYSELITCK